MSAIFGPRRITIIADMDAATLGPKLFEGRTAEVYELGPDKVLKLYNAGFERAADMEAVCLRTVAAGGIRVPRFYEVVEVDKRHGIVMERLNGKTMLALAMENPSQQRQLGVQLADLQATLFQQFHTGILKDRVQSLHHAINSVELPRAVKGRLLERLSQYDTQERLLCHYDLHLGNVILNPEPVIVDWLDASLGPPICDFARTLLLHGYPDHAGTHTETIVNAILERACFHLGVTTEDIDAWIPIIAAARIYEGFVGKEAERLLRLADRIQ